MHTKPSGQILAVTVRVQPHGYQLLEFLADRGIGERVGLQPTAPISPVGEEVDDDQSLTGLGSGLGSGKITVKPGGPGVLTSAKGQYAS